MVAGGALGHETEVVIDSRASEKNEYPETGYKCDLTCVQKLEDAGAFYTSSSSEYVVRPAAPNGLDPFVKGRSLGGYWTESMKSI